MGNLRQATVTLLAAAGSPAPLLGALARALRPGDCPWPPPAADLAAWAAGVLAAGIPDPLGWVYQLWLGRGQRRQGGAYYTHPAVVAYLCRQATAGLAPGPLGVLDPACGSGAFLAGALAVWPGARVEGWDLDPVAAAICRFNLPRARVRVTDALAEPARPKYDLVLGNPPYISSGLRGARRVTATERAALRDRFGDAVEYKLSTYPLFVVQGLRLLRPGGRLAYILPDSFLLGRYFAALRRTLLARARILEITLLDSDFWADGAVGRPTLLVAEKGEAAPGHRVQVRRCRGPAELEQPLAARSHGQAEWQVTPLQRFRLFLSDAEAGLVRELEEHLRVRPLGECLIPYSGLIGRAGQRSLLRSSYPPDHPGPWAPLLRSGREVNRYRIAWAGEQVLLEPARLKSGGRLELYRQPKLLLRQTGDALRAAYDDQGYFCLNNLHLLVPRRPGDPHDLRYWLALLNSPLLNRYYRIVTREEGRPYAQVDLDLLATLPLRQINFHDPQEQTLHAEIVALTVANEEGRPDPGALHGRICALYGITPWPLAPEEAEPGSACSRSSPSTATTRSG